MSGQAWIDLAAADRQQRVHAEVCVIGGGAAGIYLATQLARNGTSVVIVEAGPVICTDTNSIGFEPIFETAPYAGATTGRFFGMGGSTSHWGGALVPHTIYDLRSTMPFANEWAHIVNVVEDKSFEVLWQLGYRGKVDFDSFAGQSIAQATAALADCGIHVQASLHLPFRHKNLAGLLKVSKDWKLVPRVFFNAVVTTWEIRSGHLDNTNVGKVDAVINEVEAVSRNGNKLTVSADKFVIAAGAIESARILLELNQSKPQSVLPATAMPGRYLSDHLSLTIADVAPKSLKTAARMFVPRFSKGWMRTFRFLQKNVTESAPRAFAHFNFSNRSRGFYLAKEVLSAMQRKRVPAVTLADIAGGAGDLMLLLYNRFMHSRMYVPKDTPAYMQLDIEQKAIGENCIHLTDHLDEYGRSIASISWKVTNKDMDRINEMAQIFLSKWPGKKAGLPELKSRNISDIGVKPYDAYHPTGTCRMGDDVEAVVDRNLKVYGVKNLWVSSTGVLPSAGTANPTFTMLCLTHRLADHLRNVH